MSTYAKHNYLGIKSPSCHNPRVNPSSYHTRKTDPEPWDERAFLVTA